MRTIIIAEAGVNHNGSIETAYKLVDAAAASGADIIKFQTFKASELVTQQSKKAVYQQKQTGDSETQLDMLSKLELTPVEFGMVKNYCSKKNIEFMSTPFDTESIDLLEQIGVSAYKIPSGEITNYPYLKQIAGLKKPIILSTGMSSIKEIWDAINVLNSNGPAEITLMHCNTAYPTPFADANLRAINTLKSEYGLQVGYSDHTSGIEASIAAVALGAGMIEKHLTLDKNMQGPDHKASIDPAQFSDMVKAIRNIEQALGSGEKKPTPSELENINVARKSIVAKKVINKGEVLSAENITAKRPGNGISPMEWENVIGKIAKKSFVKDELIEI